MKAEKIIQKKAALNALDKVGRLSEETIRDHVGVAQGKPLPTLDCQHLIREMTGDGWIGSYTDPVLGIVYHVITQQGRDALLAMG